MKPQTVLGVVLIAALGVLNLYQYRAHAGLDAAASPALSEFSDEEVVTRFWQFLFETKAVFQNRFMGVQTIQHPFDAWVTQEIIYDVKPDLIVEAGTYRGGSAALWAMLLEQVSPDGRVVTIDVEDQVTAAKDLAIVQRKVDFLLGSSTDPEIVAEVTRRAEGRRVLVVLDSLHTKAHVLDELEAYAPLVDVGGYMIVQDGAVNGHPIMPDYGPGPWEAVQEFVAANDDFEIDLSRERFLMTGNPNGYLKRVRK
jgi:cephalosporin hydroxylase